MRSLLPFTAILFTALAWTGCTSIESVRIPPQPETEEYLGTVTVENTVWNWLFRERTEENRETLTARAQAAAEERYGKEVFLRNVHYSAAWSPRSFLMILHLGGFARQVALTADVYRLIPPAPPEPEIVIPDVEYAYVVIPSDRYTGPAGYTGILYRDAETIMSDLARSLEAGDITQKEYEEETKRIAPGGLVTIQIGRRENEGANPRNCVYTVTYPGREPIMKKGRDLIPNIPGREGLWWNEDHLALDSPISDEVRILVQDTRLKEDFPFAIRRIVKGKE